MQKTQKNATTKHTFVCVNAIFCNQIVDFRICSQSNDENDKQTQQISKIMKNKIARNRKLTQKSQNTVGFPTIGWVNRLRAPRFPNIFLKEAIEISDSRLGP